MQYTICMLIFLILILIDICQMQVPVSICIQAYNLYIYFASVENLKRFPAHSYLLPYYAIIQTHKMFIYILQYLQSKCYLSSITSQIYIGRPLYIVVECACSEWASTCRPTGLHLDQADSSSMKFTLLYLHQLLRIAISYD